MLTNLFVDILIFGEYSGRCRDAFIARGHNAVSCDFLPSDAPGPHYQGDGRDIIGDGWDMMAGFPPCTFLAASGARWHSGTERQAEAVEFVRFLMAADIPKIAIENPVGRLSTAIRKPDQIIQPWMFGHGETKATCLWLKGLPKLTPTNIVEGREPRVHRLPPSKDRWKLRSLTYSGVAEAMASQWG